MGKATGTEPSLRFRRLLAIPALLLSISALAQGIQAPPPEQTLPIGPFTDGLYTRYSANVIPDGALTEATNVLLDEDVDGVVVRRAGYSKCNTTALTDSKTVRGSWQFDASDGTKYHVVVSSEVFYQHDGDCAFTAIPGLAGFNAAIDWDCTQALGKLWCTNGATTFSWDGASTATISAAPSGTLIDNFRNRILIADITGNKSRVRLSGELDGTDWVGGSNSTSPVNIAIGGVNDGAGVTCMMGTYGDAYIIGKRDSLYGLYGFDYNDFQLRELSREVGCIDDRTVREKDGCLVWLSKRGVESMCGPNIQRVSDPIRDQIDGIIQSAGNARSATDSSQAQFQEGNLLAAGNKSPLDAVLVPAAVVLSTWAVVETSSADFVNGTLVGVTTSTVVDEIRMRGHFYNAGAEDFGGGTSYQNMVSIRSTFPATGVHFGTFIWGASGSRACPHNAIISVLDESQNPILGNTAYAITDGLAPTEHGIDISTITNTSIAFKANFGCTPTPCIASSIQTSTFSNPGGVFRFTLADGDASSQCAWRFDIDERYSTGTYTSRIFDTGFSTTVGGAFSVTGSSIAAETYLNFDVRSSSSPNNDLWGSWAASSNTLQVTQTKRYWQYRARFDTSISSKTPSLDLVGLSAGTTGQFISQCFNPGTSITSWGRFGCTTTPYDGTYTYAISTGTTCNQVTRTSATWTSQTNNNPIGVATSAYVAYRFTPSLSLFVSTGNPTVHDCTINWNEGESRPPLASVVYRNRYHLSYTSSSASGAYSDHQLVFDKKGRWTLFDDINCYSLGIYERRLYCGSSTANGQVYLMDSGTDDDGGSFTSRFKTKAYHMGDPSTRKTYRLFGAELEPEPDASYDIAPSFNYYLDRGTTPFSLSTVDLGEDADHLLWAQIPFSTDNPVSSRYIQLEGQVAGVNKPFRFYRGLLRWSPLRQD